MTKRKRALLLGGTGALGVYLAPQMVTDGFDVIITSRGSHENEKHIQYIQGNARDASFINDILSGQKYDVIIDFMIYSTDIFLDRHEALLASCSHYIFLSSYRVFSNEDVITENSPRLLDSSDDAVFLKTTDYSLEKARQEDILRAAVYRNWTIVRPSITYSKERFQLGTLEADIVIGRSFSGKPVVLPREMLSKYTTMTWAGDVAKMISALVLNEKAMGEDFNVVTSEHHTWRDVSKVYQDLIGLKLVEVDNASYLDVAGGGYAVYQIDYDRMFDRILDNSKILSFTGLEQSDFMKLNDGLTMELSNLSKDSCRWPIDYGKQGKIDRLTRVFSQLSSATYEEKKTYIRARFPRISVLMTRLNIDSLKERIRFRTRIRTVLKSVKHAVRIRTRIRGVNDSILHTRRHRRFSKPDGAIVTLLDYNNYGNIMQRYALQEFLFKSDHRFVSYEHNLPIMNDLSDGRVRYTAEFTRRYISTQRFDKDQELPCYIVGSDQIWRDFSYEHPKDQIGFFFLNFLGDRVVDRIAYAASFGRNSLDEARITPSISKYLLPYVEKFKAISVRERAAVDMVKDAWGVDSELVIDPTMLLPASVYSGLINRSPQQLESTNGVFAYLIGVSEENDHLLDKAVAHVQNGLYRIDLADYSGPLPPVEQWLCGLRDAKLVVIDSFHGAVFSIINNTDFVVLENQGSGMERMVNLLDLFGIQDRIIRHGDVDAFSFDDLAPIDWGDVNKRLEKLRTKSAEWLLDAVRSSKSM